MTVAALAVRATYTDAGDAATLYAIPFQFLSASQVKVSRFVAGVETVLSGFTVTGAGRANPPTGMVQLTDAVAGSIIEVRRVTDLTQPVTYGDRGDFPADLHQDTSDREMMAIQEQAAEIARAFKVPRGEAPASFPSVADRASKLLGFDAAGNPRAQTSTLAEASEEMAHWLDLAEGYATAPENAQVAGAPTGARSALHYAAKAGEAQLDATGERVAAEQAAASALLSSVSAGALPNAYAATLPKGVTSIAVGTAGSGGTPGTYAGGVTGGPAGFAWTYTIGGGGAITATAIVNAGLATAGTAPTLSFPSGSLAGSPAATATVASLIAAQGRYLAASADGQAMLLYKNDGTATPAAVNNPDGSQIALAQRYAIGSCFSVAVAGTARSRVRAIALYGDVDPDAGYVLADFAYHDSGTRCLARIVEVPAGAAYYVDWATMAAAIPADGTIGIVNSADGGTHTDPVVGGTVPNNGRFVFVDPDGWQYVNNGRVCDLLIGSGAAFSGVHMLTVPATNGSGISAALVADYGGGSTPFSAFNGTPTNALISPDQIVTTPALTAAIAAQIDAALVVEDARQGPWLDTVRSTQLRDCFEDIQANEAAEGARYGLGFVEIANYNPSLWRITLRIKDFVTGDYVAEWVGSWDHEPVATDDLHEQVHAHKNSLSGYAGTIFEIRFNLAAVQAAWATASPFTTTYSLYSQCGIRPELCLSSERMDDFPHAPNPSATARIGSALDFSTLTAHTQSLYLPDAELPDGFPTYTSFPLSFACSYSSQQKSELVDEAVELVAGLILNPYQIVQGLGMDVSYLKNVTAAKRVLEASFPVIVSDLTLWQTIDEYIAHMDNDGTLSKAATMGPGGQHFFIRQLWRRVRFLVEAAHSVSMIGTGLSGGQQLYSGDCLIHHRDPASPAVGWLIHDTPRTLVPGLVHMTRLVSNLATAPSILLQAINCAPVRHRVVLDDCTLPVIKGEVDIADNSAGMPARARDRWPFEIEANGGTIGSFVLSDAKMRVLTAGAGVSVTGTGGVTLFGDRQDSETGRGDQLAGPATSIRHVAARLGNLTSASQTMTFRSVAHAEESAILNENYTGMSEAAVLADINGQLTNYNVTAMRIDTEIVV